MVTSTAQTDLPMQPVVFKKTVSSDDIRTASALLAAGTGLSKTKVKEAMIKGAVWLKKTSANVGVCAARPPL